MEEKSSGSQKLRLLSPRLCHAMDEPSESVRVTNVSRHGSTYLGRGGVAGGGGGVTRRGARGGGHAEGVKGGGWQIAGKF